MKVLALNGSPRMKASSTYHMLKPLLEGMEAAGAETEVIHIRKLKLEACLGCYTCWVHTPGECVHRDKDGMGAALESYHSADLVVFGTPLYHFSMSGIMKTFIDRTLPSIEPWLIPHPDIPDVTFHPERFHKPSKIMLVSPCGFPEFDHFKSLVTTFRHMAHMERFEYLGEILRPSAEPLSRKALQGLFASYYDIVRQAGEQIIRDGRISEATQADLRQDLFPGGKQAFYDMSAAYWEQQMDRFKVPEELRHTVPLPEEKVDSTPVAAPNVEVVPVTNLSEKSSMEEETAAALPRWVDRSTLTCREIIAGMPRVFNAEVAGDMTADIQFHVSGTETGDYYLHIAGGTCAFHEGVTATPQLTIHTPAEVWVAVSNGELDGQQAFMQSKYRVEGDFSLLMKLNDLFKAG